MSKQHNMFQRLAMLEKIDAMGHADAIQTLDEELHKINGLNTRLREIVTETELKSGTTNMMALRSAQHYVGKIHEQLKLIGNRKIFIEEEIAQETETMGKILSRQKHATEKARQQVIQERDAREEKAATDVPRLNATGINHR